MTAAANSTESPTIRKANPRKLDGDAQLRRIARAGRQWKMTIGRREDMESESLIISIMLTGVALTERDLQRTCTDCASSGRGCGRMIVGLWPTMARECHRWTEGDTPPLVWLIYMAHFMSPDNAPGFFVLLYHEILSHLIIISHNFVRLTNIWPDISHQNLAPLPKMKILRDIPEFEMGRR